MMLLGAKARGGAARSERPRGWTSPGPWWCECGWGTPRTGEHRPPLPGRPAGCASSLLRASGVPGALWDRAAQRMLFRLLSPAFQVCGWVLTSWRIMFIASKWVLSSHKSLPWDSADLRQSGLAARLPRYLNACGPRDGLIASDPTHVLCFIKTMEQWPKEQQDAQT